MSLNVKHALPVAMFFSSRIIRSPYNQIKQTRNVVIDTLELLERCEILENPEALVIGPRRRILKLQIRVAIAVQSL